MKLTIGLLAFICISAISIHLAVIKKIDYGLTIILLCFSIAAGFVIANYDIIKNMEFGKLKLEMAKKEILDVKESAISDIREEIVLQKNSINLLIRDANNSSKKLESQKNDIDELIKLTEKAEREIEARREEIIFLNTDTNKARQEIIELNDTAKKIAQIFMRTAYLVMETKNEFGGPRDKKARQEIFNDLNKLLPMIIKNPDDRAKWVSELQNLLPKK